jgi:hypothetical protein
MNRKTITTLGIVALLTGCATPIKTVDYYDMPTEALLKIRGMQQFPDSVLTDNNYTDAGIVTAMSCRRNTTTDSESGGAESERKTFDQLEILAALLGADHITVPNCVENDEMDLNNNCWSSLVCESHALKVTQTESAEKG